MKKQIFSLALTLFLAVFLSGCSNISSKNGIKTQSQEKESQNTSASMVNPASAYCTESGGDLKIEKKIVDGEDKGEYGVCYFEDNRQCEEWALFRGACPKGGLKVTGFENQEQIYCAILGAQVDMQNSLCLFSNGAECDINDLYAGECKQYYSDTGAGWKYKKYPTAGVMIGYLSNEIKFPEESNNKELTLSVKVEKVSEIGDATMGYDKETSQKDIDSLDKGEFGENVDFGLKDSQKVIQLSDGKTYAKEFIVLSRFEVCSVVFDRVLIFYHNGYRTILTLTADKDKIIEENPGYFAKNVDNCGEDLVWNFKDDDIQKQFYKDLSSGKLDGATTGNWYHVFDEIAGAVDFQKR